jgi:crossover junction endodeoxyribonuclease RuvC
VRILGIDPGTARLGYGIIDAGDGYAAVDFGTIETSAKDTMAQRLLQLHQALTHLIATHAPEGMAIEQLFFSRNVTTAIAVGQARGVALLAAAQSGLPVTEYTPAEVKQAISGYGNADKQQVQFMVQLLLELDAVPYPDDAADALAVALCHGQSHAFQDRVSSSGGYA